MHHFLVPVITTHLQFRKHLVTLLDPCSGISNQLVNNSLGALLLVHNSGGLAHQERSCVIHSIVINVITQSLKVVLNGNNTLARKLLDLRSAVLLPVFDICVIADTERSASKDDCADIVVVASSADSLLVSLWRTSLISQDKAGTDPNGGSTKHKSSSNSLTVVDTTSGDNLDRRARHRAGLALAELDNSWDQNSCGNIASVSSSLTTLCANDVDAEIEALLDVLGVANHVHVKDAGFVETVDDMLGRDTDGGDEELGAAVDDDANELVEFALSIIVVCLSGASTNLGEKQVNTEGCVLVCKEGLELCDLLAQHVWCVSYSSDDTESSCIGDGCGELGTGCDVHSCEEDGVVDLQEVSDRCADYLF